MKRIQLAALKNVVTSKLARQLAITVYASILIVSLITIAYRYADSVAFRFEEAERNMADVFRASVDNTTFPVLSELIEVGEHLVRIDAILGVTYVNGIGEDQASFGQVPELTWRDATLAQISRRQTSDGQFVDIYLRPETTGIQFGVFVRSSAQPIWQAVWADLREDLITSLIIGLASALLIATAIIVSILDPLRRITKSIREGAQDPERADLAVTKIKRNDELGRMSEAANSLLRLTSHLFNEDLANALGVIDGMPAAVLIYSPEGELLEANLQALGLYGVETKEGLPNSDDIDIVVDGVRYTAIEIASNLEMLTHGLIKAGTQEIPVHVAGASVQKLEGQVTRYFVTIVDARESTALIEELTAQNEDLERNLRDQRLKSEDLSELLEASQTLMEIASATNSGHPRPRSIMVDRCVRSWNERAVSVGQMSPECLKHGFLPPVRGDDKTIQRIFRSALTIVRSRSSKRYPKIGVSSKTASENICTFTIAEVQSFEGKPKVAFGKQTEDGDLHVSVLTKLIPIAGGSIMSLIGASSENTITFSMPIDRAGLSMMRGSVRRKKAGAEAA